MKVASSSQAARCSWVVAGLTIIIIIELIILANRDHEEPIGPVASVTGIDLQFTEPDSFLMQPTLVERDQAPTVTQPATELAEKDLAEEEDLAGEGDLAEEGDLEVEDAAGDYQMPVLSDPLLPATATVESPEKTDDPEITVADPTSIELVPSDLTTNATSDSAMEAMRWMPEVTTYKLTATTKTMPATTDTPPATTKTTLEPQAVDEVADRGPVLPDFELNLAPPSQTDAQSPRHQQSILNRIESLFANDMVSPAEDSETRVPTAVTAGNTPMPTPPPSALTGDANRELRIAAELADGHVRKGMDVATRGALYSARNEFIQALRVVAESYDATTNQTTHSAALSRGLRALNEVADFMPHGAQLAADIDIERILASHRTPVLKSDESLTDKKPSRREVLDSYYVYAYEQFAVAGGSMPASSMALYGLAKIYTSLAEKRQSDRSVQQFRAMVLHQSALLVDPNNPLAANELGVLLAKYGRLEESYSLLQRSLAAMPQVAVWHNLAKVSARLGNTVMAEHALSQAKMLPTTGDTSSGVRWLNYKAFGQIALPDSAPVVSTGQSVLQTPVRPPVAIPPAQVHPQVYGAGPTARQQTLRHPY